MNEYTLTIVHERATDAERNSMNFCTETETITVQAESLEKARRLAPFHTKIANMGRWMRIYHNGVELLGNF